MNQFSYYLLPNYPFPTLYFTAMEPIIQNQTFRAQVQFPVRPLQNIQTGQTSQRLQLSEEQLLEAGYQKKSNTWTVAQDQRLLQLVMVQNIPWRQIEIYMPNRTIKMCYSRFRRLQTQSRQKWAPQAQSKLCQLVETYGEQWKQFVSQFPNRTWKQLRDKYLNYLRPDINKDKWSLEQDMKILELINRHGTQWKTIQQEMQNRTDNQIKNRYYGRLKLLLKRKGLCKNKK